jgi:hypothetical protein
MAYISKTEVQQKAVQIKALLKEYGFKGTVAGSNSSTLRVRITEGKLDVIANMADTADALPYAKFTSEEVAKMRQLKYTSVNPYWYHEHYSGTVLEFLKRLFGIMNEGNHDNSDIMTDYFDVGWYNSVMIGDWDKPYVLVK